MGLKMNKLFDFIGNGITSLGPLGWTALVMTLAVIILADVVDKDEKEKE